MTGSSQGAAAVHPLHRGDPYEISFQTAKGCVGTVMSAFMPFAGAMLTTTTETDSKS
jgi:hypothetical protein